MWDFDNDGFRDVAAWGSTGLNTFRGGPQGKFQAAEIVEGPLASPIRAVTLRGPGPRWRSGSGGGHARRVELLINQGGTSNNWLTLYPMGQEDNKGRCNHDAIGSLVELRAGGWYQAQVVESPTVHFGLGDRKVAEQVRIVWTNGVPSGHRGTRGQRGGLRTYVAQRIVSLHLHAGRRAVLLLHRLPVGCTAGTVRHRKEVSLRRAPGSTCVFPGIDCHPTKDRTGFR